jgi:hypothetical protein
MDPNQIRFRTGEKQPFIATRAFALGNTGATVPKGAELYFDGSIVEFAGQTFPFPQLRGAIKMDWVVRPETYDESDPNYGRPERANIQVRHATQGGNPMQPQPKMAIQTTQDDEREVASVRQHANQVATANRNYVRGNPVNVATAGETVRGQHGFEVVEPQDGVEIPGRTLKTAAGDKAKASRTVLTAESAALALQKASNVTIQAGQGITREEMLERMTPEARELYLAQTEALRSQYVNEPSPPPRTVVASVPRRPAQQTEGMTIRQDVGHGVEVADPGALATSKPKESVVYEDGIAFKTTNGPGSVQPTPSPRALDAQAKAASVNGTADSRRMVAKLVCPDFPDNYQFDQPVKKKMARLTADYEDRPDVIRAVFAAETDEVKSYLAQEFPQAFQQ